MVEKKAARWVEMLADQMELRLAAHSAGYLVEWRVDDSAGLKADYSVYHSVVRMV